MKRAILLDGSQKNDGTGERIRAVLTDQLQARGWKAKHIALCNQEIGNCGGEFFCWTKHPGMCMLDDDNRVIAEELTNCDLVVYLTPVTFGGYSSTLKSMVDHQIQNISPFFATIDGETHHRTRYGRYPDLLAVSWMDEPEERSATVFQHLVQRNALNWHSPTWVSDVVLAGQSDGALLTSAQKWLTNLQNGRSSPRVELPANSPSSTTLGTHDETVEIRRALLLVGSPKTRKSTSASLGGYLFEQLSTRFIQCETMYLHLDLRSPEKTQALLDAVDAADLVILAFPLYVDSLPAPVIDALERVAAHRRQHSPSRRQLFAAIANCGFPEAHHCATALAICATFTRQAGFEWSGSLALGGGGMVGGVPLAEGGGKTLLIRKGLELAADALAQGQAIPQAAQDAMASPVIPSWAYRLMGDLGWIWAARSNGALRLLKRKPYQARGK